MNSITNTRPLTPKEKKEATTRYNDFVDKHNINKKDNNNMIGYEFRDSSGMTLDEANEANKKKKKPVSRYTGPVQTRDFDTLDTAVEREAFLGEAMESAAVIARQFGSKKSFMKYVAMYLHELAVEGGR